MESSGWLRETGRETAAAGLEIGGDDGDDTYEAYDDKHTG
jgi:hypothetical protein